MQDAIIKGTGNSRYLKSIETFLTQYPTYQDFAAALAAGTLPIDLNGINETGWDQLGTALNKASLLSDETCSLLHLENTAVPDDAFSILSERSPAGSVFWFAAQTAPNGFLICDGSAISRTDYAALFSAIGTAFGGSGNTFNLPNLRAKFIRGSGSQGGYSATFGRTQEATSIGVYDNGDYLSGISDEDRIGGGGSYNFLDTGPASVSYVGHYVRPYNIALTPIIKY